MLNEMMSKELVTINFKDFTNFNSLIEVMAGGCGFLCGGGSAKCSDPT